MSDTASEGKVLFEAQQAAIDRGRIDSLVTRVESLEMRLAGLSRYCRETMQYIADQINDCQRRIGEQEEAPENEPGGPDLLGGATKEQVERHRAKSLLDRLTLLEKDVYGFAGVPREEGDVFHWKVETRVSALESKLSAALAFDCRKVDTIKWLVSMVKALNNDVFGSLDGTLVGRRISLGERVSALEARLSDDGR